METHSGSRRMFLKTGIGVTASQCFPGLAVAQGSSGPRLEWQQFKTTSQYPAFVNAIATMRSNTNQASPGSLSYWSNVHVNTCPHGVPYFISWHRGYLYHFEQQLRSVSGNPYLTLPYWNYYSYATLPAEFTDPAPTNPLYVPRQSSNVYGALSMAPFASAVRNFQRGKSNAFEPSIEDVHNPIHDLIGGVMSTMQSPLDPIFFLHHASIDRLTHAWSLLAGKTMPKSANPYSSTNSDAYWAGNHLYATGLSIERYKTRIPSWLGTTYASNTVPTALPPAPAASAARAALLQRPPFRSFRTVAGRRLSNTRRSVSGVAQVPFDEQSVSVLLRLAKSDAAELARVVALCRDGGEPDVRADVRADIRQMPGMIKLVFDNVSVGAAAKKGGFFYALYLDMPAVVESQAARDASLIGTLGAFQIAAAAHHGTPRIEFDVSYLLARQERVNFTELALSWVRVDGDRPPAGKAILANEIRVELAFAPDDAHGLSGDAEDIERQHL
ncbi:tyrosinase [Massilia sp. MP_M2]|uniref:tyrosinase family protein n=1 Tax=Massilia sp. MP_M2 TaxID=3071713 RepID=UPI00319DC4E1